MSGRRVIALTASRARGTPAAAWLWEVELPGAGGPPAIAAVDSSGKPAVLVSADDGWVYCIQ